MTDLRDEFLSEEDLDLRNLSQDELIAYWNLWLEQAQATNDLDEALYSHGVFERDPSPEGHNHSGQLRPPPLPHEAAQNVIVHHPRRLHEGVADGGAHEAEAAAFE